MDWSCYRSFHNLIDCLGNQSDHWLNVDLVLLSVFTLLVMILWQPALVPLGRAVAHGLKWMWRRVTELLVRKPYGIPQGGLVVIPLPDSRWQLVTSAGGKPILLLHAHFNVTNTYGHAIQLPNSFVRKPRVAGLPVVRPTPINPQNVADVRTSYALDPKPRGLKLGAPYTTDVIIVDQYGAQHHVSVTFQPL